MAAPLLLQRFRKPLVGVSPGWPKPNDGLSFPVNGIRDTFDRADENPLANGNWTGVIASGQGGLKLVSNQAASIAAGDSASYWSTTQFAADQESFVDMPVLTGAGKNFNVWVRVQNPGNPTTGTGYTLGVTPSTGLLKVFKLTAGVTFAQVSQTVSQTVTAGDGFGLSIIGSRLFVWYRVGPAGFGGWKLVQSFTEPAITGPGYIGLEVDDTTGRADNFGGGEIPVASAVSASVNSVVGNLSLAADTSAFLEALAPTVGNLTLGAPAPALAEALAPTIGNLSLAGNTQALRLDLLPTIGTLVLGAVAPTLSFTNDISITQVVGVLNLTGISPAPALAVSEVVGTLTLGAPAPTVSEAVAPSVGLLTLSGITPQIAEALLQTPGVLTLTGNVQSIADRSINSSVGVLLLRADAPTLSGAISAAGDTSVQLWLYFIN